VDAVTKVVEESLGHATRQDLADFKDIVEGKLNQKSEVKANQ